MEKYYECVECGASGEKELALCANENCPAQIAFNIAKIQLVPNEPEPDQPEPDKGAE